MSRITIIGTNALLASAERLHRCGEITEEQFKEMQQRNNNLPNEIRKDIIEV